MSWLRCKHRRRRVPVGVTFSDPQGLLKPNWLGTKIFGPGSATSTMTTADGKTPAQCMAESRFGFAAWHELSKPWGPPSAPSDRTKFWLGCAKAMVDAGLGWALMTMMMPLDVSPRQPPQTKAGNYPSGNAERGIGWTKQWAQFCLDLFGVPPEYWENDNEWATRAQNGIPPMWYTDSQNCADYGTTNFRTFADAVRSIPGLEELVCLGFSYADGATSTPSTHLDPQAARYVSGQGWGNYPWPDKNTAHGDLSMHAYGNVAGKPIWVNAGRSPAQIISDINTLRRQYARNVDYVRSIVPWETKYAQTEWWITTAHDFDPVSLARECVGDIVGFIDHAANVQEWNVHALALWGVGPGDVTNPDASPESIISTRSGKLVLRPRYMVARDMLCRFAQDYPQIVASQTDGDVPLLAGRSRDGNGGAALLVNMSDGPLTPTVDIEGFTPTGTYKLPSSLALDAPLATTTGAVPSLAPLESVIVVGALAGGQPPDPEPEPGEGQPVWPSFWIDGDDLVVRTDGREGRLPLT